MISESQGQCYCSEPITQIENYTLARNDTNTIYVCHHRNEIVITLTGMQIISRDELVRQGRCCNIPASELIYLPIKEHNRIHVAAKQRCKQFNYYWSHNKMTEEMRKIIAKSYYSL